MAEAKYDLLLHPGRGDQKVYNQPWYKERLRTKYIKKLKPGETISTFQGKNWTFVKDGLDDFRDGLPPTTDGMVLKGTKGFGPTLTGSSDDISTVKRRAHRKRFTAEEMCFSKLTPLQAQRRDHIDEIEYGLTQHPLALYPHLEECLPPDVFEDVVDILDPEMNLVDEDEDGGEGGYEDEMKDLQRTPTPLSQKQAAEKEEFAQESEEPKVRNPYRWLPRKDEKDKKDKKKAPERRSSSPSEDEHINQVTKDFCDWVASLGGESNNIEESTITSLFASGYETKPALSVPIHVVELTNVPPELRNSAAVPTIQPSKLNTPPYTTEKKQDWKYLGAYEPSWVKFQYGAWYLSPHTWKKRNADEPLLDPQEIKDQQMTEAKKKSNDLDQELAPMHGAKAFVEFIDKKAVRKPEFLERVGEIQQEQERLEQARIEAEIAKQKKREQRNEKGSGD